MSSVIVDHCFSFVHGHVQRPPELRPAVHRAITISRQTGCGALEIAAKVARYMGRQLNAAASPWTVFDRNLMERVLEDHRLPPSLARYLPEDRMSMFEDLIADVLGIYPSSQKAAQQTAETLLGLAELGGVILIGRGANLITAKVPHVLHVRLVAPLADRAERIAAQHQISPAQAREFCVTEDLARARYLKQHFRAEIDNPQLYHLTLNTSLLGCDESARLISDSVMHLP